MRPVRIRHSIWEIVTQPSHSVDTAGWQAKMAFIELWIQRRNTHGPHWPRLVLWLSTMGLVRNMSLSSVSMESRTRRPVGWQAENWQMRSAVTAREEDRGWSFHCEQSWVGFFFVVQDGEVVLCFWVQEPSTSKRARASHFIGLPTDRNWSCFARSPCLSQGHQKTSECVGSLSPRTAHGYPKVFRRHENKKKSLRQRVDPLPSTPPNLSPRPYRTGVLYGRGRSSACSVTGPVYLEEPKQVLEKRK